MNSVIALIQSDIKNHARQSAAIVQRIRTLKLRGAETGPERNALWNDKRLLGDKTRHFLLAYAYLRHRLRASQEARCRRPPSVQLISRVISESGGGEPDAEALKAWVDASA